MEQVNKDASWPPSLATAVLGVALLLVPAVSEAGWYFGRIAKLEWQTNRSVVYVGLNLAVDPGAPPCATNPNGFHVAFDASGDAGRRTFAALLTAQASQRDVNIFGGATCTVGGNVEDVAGVQTQ